MGLIRGWRAVPPICPCRGLNIQTGEDLRKQVGSCYLAVGATLMYSGSIDDAVCGASMPSLLGRKKNRFADQ